MPETLKASWHMLPEPVKQQAAARWSSGISAAGPGDGYVYKFKMVDEFGHQPDLFDIRATYGPARLFPRLVGRCIDNQPRPVVSKHFQWSRVDL